MAIDENIQTQVQSFHVDNRSSGVQLNLGAGDGNPQMLDKTVVDALQNVTKDQVRKILMPILASLETALEKQVSQT